MNKLLYDESPLTFSPTIASALGLNAAIVLQQLHYWLCKNQQSMTNIRDGKVWCYDTYEKWRERSFPFWSADTIKRTFLSLEKKGIVISRQYGKYERNRVKWYTIDYRILNDILQKGQMENAEKANPSGQIAPFDEGNLPRSMRADCTDLYNIYNIYNHIDTETSTETSSDKNVNGAFLKKKHDLSFSNRIERLEHQVLRLCDAEGCSVRETESIIHVIVYFYETHDERFVQKHPFISDDAMLRVIRRLCEGTYDDEVPSIVEYEPEFYEEMIDKYFNTEFPNEDCDYHINHFMTNGILAMRAYETQMNMN